MKKQNGSDSKTVTFTLERETPGALRYAEVDGKSGKPIDLKGPKGMDAAVVGTLYIRKAALDGKMPKSLSITINV